MANTHSLSLVKASVQWADTSSTDPANLDITGDLSMECWVKPSSSLTSLEERAFGAKAAAGNNKSYYFGYRDIGSSNPQLFLMLSSGGVSYDVRGVETSIPNSTWTHVAVTYKASTSAYNFYKNGSSIGSTTGSVTAIFNGNSKFQVGYNGETSSYFDGLIDEVRVWNTERTSSEISNNYLVELTGSESGLQGYWQLNNNYNDSTSNAYNMVGNNSPTFSSDVPFGAPVSVGGLLLMGVGS